MLMKKNYLAISILLFVIGILLCIGVSVVTVPQNDGLTVLMIATTMTLILAILLFVLSFTLVEKES